MITRDITEYQNDRVTKLGIYAFANCNSLTSVNLPNVSSASGSTFQQCTSLISVNLPKISSLGTRAFSGCTSLTSVKFPKVTKININAFDGCTELASADFPRVTSVSSNSFKGCTSLVRLILRHEVVVTITANSLTDTPIASGTGYIYVPASTIDGYKADTVWSTYATQFRALEDYTVDGTITGELDESKI